ncbi:discoidin domain-containing protein [Nonomuraea diastatica]|uniref:discoidin domain-containing protein n=1 Tax=Nonomuraea diastatica TaxID=1848329 RepID=UPI00269A05DC
MSPPPGPGIRRLGALLVLLVTLSLLSAAPAGAADTLLSQGRTVTASSTENAAFPASAAVDGDAGTRWSSAFSDPQWLQVDLGAAATISQVRLSWEAAYATAFTVQVSADGTSWTDLYATTATGGDQTLDVSGSGRYVRVHGTPGVARRGHLDHHPQHHQRQRVQADPERHRLRPVRAHVRHPACHRLRLQPLGVPGVRHRR